MGLASPRFTIRSLMIAVAIIAGVLGLYQLWAILLAALLGLLIHRPRSACGGGCFAASVAWRRSGSGPRPRWATSRASSARSTGSASVGVLHSGLAWLASFPLVLGAGSAWAVEVDPDRTPAAALPALGLAAGDRTGRRTAADADYLHGRFGWHFECRGPPWSAWPTALPPGRAHGPEWAG